MVKIFNKNKELIKEISYEEYKNAEKKVYKNYLNYIKGFINYISFFLNFIKSLFIKIPILYFWIMALMYYTEMEISIELLFSNSIVNLVILVCLLSLVYNFIISDKLNESEFEKDLYKKLGIKEDGAFIKFYQDI